MRATIDSLYLEAVELLEALSTSEGILASSIEADNYKRIWARDSIVCGITGLYINNEKIVQGLRKSLEILAKHQHSNGMIPSNVHPVTMDCSYGSLVGRVDTCTWFIIGCCLYFKHQKDESFWKLMTPHIEQSRAYLKAIEFNGKGWIYTPLSGNWADEYPVHGYTLYDNMLRLWGEQLWMEAGGVSDVSLNKLLEKTKINFWPSSNHEKWIYQQGPFQSAAAKIPKHFAAFILPGIYDLRFDAAANGLALLIYSLNTSEIELLSAYITQLRSELGTTLIPAFWPTVTEESKDWDLLKGNYSFEFKNIPGAFHNSGIWPVWMGLFCWGLAQNGMHKEVDQIVESFSEQVAAHPNWNFHEFFNSKSMRPEGKEKMGYTASGIVYMQLALKNCSV